MATPEQRASVFNATRSPRRSLWTGPLTVATWAIGVKELPSWRCHVILFEFRSDRKCYAETVTIRAVQLTKDFLEEWYTG